MTWTIIMMYTMGLKMPSILTNFSQHNWNFDDLFRQDASVPYKCTTPPKIIYSFETLCSLDGTFVSVIFISIVTSDVGLQEEEPQTAHPMSFTWASHIAASVHYGM